MPQTQEKKKRRTIKDVRAQGAAAQRRFKQEHPEEWLKQQCRNAVHLLERNGFVVTGGNLDLTPKRERYRKGGGERGDQ